MKSKHETNEQFVKRIMNHCPTGALSQAFIITAIEWYAREVIAAGLEDQGASFINPEAWTATAEYVLGELDRQYA